MRRRFNTNERVAVFLVAGGKCEDCGEELRPGWHGDHDDPFSRGGPTEATNIRALCPKCNLKKGNKKMARLKIGLWPEKIKLRDWQTEALDMVRQHQSEDFLSVATPGAGKTIFAIRAAHTRLIAGQSDFIAVVAPSDFMVKQWIDDASECGIDLYRLKNADGVPPPDFHGIVVTYQQVCSMPSIYRVLCGRNNVMTIFDECHHMGDQNEWGAKMREAFGPAKFRLSLSGTPFRTDETPIPFVNYEKDGGGECLRDYTYGYTRAIKDGNCRAVEFPSWNATVKWLKLFDDEAETIELNFDAEVNEFERAKRLNAALWDENYLTAMVKAGNEYLVDVRLEHPNAGGLIIAIDKNHANKLSKIVRRITGFTPRVVTYDNDDAVKDIETFRENAEPWIIAIKMIGEGVSIKRLRVAVHCTVVTAEMSVRQLVGRIVRRVGDFDDISYYIIPKDPKLMKTVKLIEDDVIAAIKEMNLQTRPYNPIDMGTKDRPLYVSIGAEDERPDDSTYRGKVFDRARVEMVMPLLQKSGIRCSAAQWLSFLEDCEQSGFLKMNGDGIDRIEPEYKTRQPKNDRVAELRIALGKQISYWEIKSSEAQKRPIDHKTARIKVNRQLGFGKSYTKASEEELMRLHKWVEEQILKII